MALRRPSRRQDSTVPTDSLSDIAFLLIIFFILTTSIRRLTGFTSEIPAAQKATQQQTEKTPSITLRDGALMFNDQPVELGQLRAELSRLNLGRKNPSEQIVLMEATGRVSYQQYYEVMAAISGAGGVVGVITEEKTRR